jgi:hypothetical protein
MVSIHCIDKLLESVSTVNLESPGPAQLAEVRTISTLLTLACSGGTDQAAFSSAGAAPQNSKGGYHLPARDRYLQFSGEMASTPEGLKMSRGNYKGPIVDSCRTGPVAAYTIMGRAPREFVLVIYEVVENHIETIGTGGGDMLYKNALKPPIKSP